MSDIYWVLAVGIITVCLVFWLIRYARRVDRLHRRVIQARITLDKRLRDRRVAVETLITRASANDDEVDALRTALDTARHVSDEQSESTLSRTLRQYRTHPRCVLNEDQHMASQLQSTADELRAARRFYNQEVEQVRRIRSRIVVRIFHLAGRAELPRTFDMDDRY
ncbi:MAG: hypothetical protein Q4P71_05605 [Actinomycetaceae bacterium]|nr:hypothetical protein [Actinomycetaceae bacterium]